MSQSVFSIVKENVSALQVAQMYGLKVSSKGMACCPFHTDKSPSMKVDRRYYCFGCGATGDAVDLAAQLLGMTPRDAAVKIADDFGIPIDEKTVPKSRTKAPAKARADPQKEAAEWIMKSVRMLLDYKWKLSEWKTKYAPRSMDEEWHPLFCEALDKREWIEYLLDELMFCGKDEYADMKIRHGKEVKALECKLVRLLERESECDQGYQVENDIDRKRTDQTDDEQLSGSNSEGSAPEGSLSNEQADRENRHRKRSWVAER